MNHVTFSVEGTPVAQGSMVLMKGRIRHQRSERLETWREEVAMACRQAMRRQKEPMFKPWEGAVEISMSYLYPLRKRSDEAQFKTTAPDLDKLQRAVLDALTGVLYVDDKQVACVSALKRFVEDGEDPGLIVNAHTLRTEE